MNLKTPCIAHHEVQVHDGLQDEGEEQHGGRGEHEDTPPCGQAHSEGAAQVWRLHSQVNEGREFRQLRQAVHNVQELHNLHAQEEHDNSASLSALPASR